MFAYQKPGKCQKNHEQTIFIFVPELLTDIGTKKSLISYLSRQNNNFQEGVADNYSTAASLSFNMETSRKGYSSALFERSNTWLFGIKW